MYVREYVCISSSCCPGVLLHVYMSSYISLFRGPYPWILGSMMYVYMYAHTYGCMYMHTYECMYARFRVPQYHWALWP